MKIPKCLLLVLMVSLGFFSDSLNITTPNFLKPVSFDAYLNNPFSIKTDISRYDYYTLEERSVEIIQIIYHHLMQQ